MLALLPLLFSVALFAADQDLQTRIAPPAGYVRLSQPPDSFGAWLRGLPLKPGVPEVKLYNGSPKPNQSAQAAVFAIDVGEKDLQQCADAVIRLRAEYLYSRKKFSDIRFKFTSGHEASFAKWAEGSRPHVRGNRVEWRRGPSSARDESYPNFRRYLETVFMYAGSLSLERDLKSVPPKEVLPGDVFVEGGSPGHAVIVADVAVKEGQRSFLLAQSYMPAQEIHLLKNPKRQDLGPWYVVEGDELVTPEWTFGWDSLKRFF